MSTLSLNLDNWLNNKLSISVANNSWFEFGLDSFPWSRKAGIGRSSSSDSKLNCFEAKTVL
jgi:hypothetical protein